MLPQSQLRNFKLFLSGQTNGAKWHTPWHPDRVFDWSSETVVQLAISERAIGIRGVDFFDYVTAQRISEIQAERNAVLPLIVAADVVQSREGLAAIGGPAIETESRWLERTTTRVPQVVFVAQPETVNVAPDRKCLGWPEHYFAEEVRIVHGVEERKARVDAGRG